MGRFRTDFIGNNHCPDPVHHEALKPEGGAEVFYVPSALRVGPARYITNS